MVRVTYELQPAAWAKELARIEAGEVVVVEDGRAVLEFPQRNWGSDVTLLVSSLLAGEWADSAALERCRLGRFRPSGCGGPTARAYERWPRRLGSTAAAPSSGSRTLQTRRQSPAPSASGPST